jgi:hypothetical protein
MTGDRFRTNYRLDVRVPARTEPSPGRRSCVGITCHIRILFITNSPQVSQRTPLADFRASEGLNRSAWPWRFARHGWICTNSLGCRSRHAAPIEPPKRQSRQRLGWRRCRTRCYPPPSCRRPWRLRRFSRSLDQQHERGNWDLHPTEFAWDPELSVMTYLGDHPILMKTSSNIPIPWINGRP